MTGPPTRCGVDLVDVGHFRRGAHASPNVIGKVFTRQELDECSGQWDRLAARFAAKEAAAKALGTGIRGVSWQEFEIVSLDTGEPLLRLYGNARQQAEALGLAHWAVSLSHTANLAVAVVVATASNLTGGA